MKTAKRGLIGLALAGAMVGGIVALPHAASASAQPNDGFQNCEGYYISAFSSTVHHYGQLLHEIGVNPGEDLQALHSDVCGD